MSAAALAPPPAAPPLPPALPPPPAGPTGLNAVAALRRFTVAEYHKLIDLGILTDEDRVELLHGLLVLKMAKNPPHESTVRKLNRRLPAVLPPGWVLGCQGPVTLAGNEPEPDFSIARGAEDAFDTRHPGPADVGLLIEVADSSLARDRFDKGPIYAAAGIPVYWIVNLIDRQVEVYTDPDPAADTGYRTVRLFGPADAVPVELDGTAVGTVPVAEVLA